MKKKLMISILLLFLVVTIALIIIYKDQTITVLGYHDFTSSESTNEMQMEIANFEKQMKYLHDNGYTTLFLSEIETAKNYDKPIIITFDDGYDNVYNNAFPIMKKYNIKSDLYLITRFNPRPLYVDTNMIKEMDTSGIVEMGSHTLVHVNLAQVFSSTAWYISIGILFPIFFSFNKLYFVLYFLNSFAKFSSL